MGVKGLWQLLEPVGRPVTLESLENKILGVDASVILNQSVKGMRDRHGNPIPNAHLVGLFNRVCKLLYYRIKPVFVFDGGVPHLKKKTLALRKERRFKAIHGSKIAAERIAKNFLKAKALETVTGKKSTSTIRSKSPREPDVFELSPLPAGSNSENISVSEDEDMDRPILEQFHNQHLEETFQNPSTIDIDSEDFKTLPPEIQHELIKEMKEERKWMNNSGIFKYGSDFASFQLEGVLKRGKMNQRLDELRKEMNKRNSGELAGLSSHESLTGNSTVLSQKILSEDTAHYILIKGNDQMQEQNKQEISTEACSKDFSSEGGFFQKEPECKVISWTLPRPEPRSSTNAPFFDIPDISSSDSEPLTPFVDVPEAYLSPTSSQEKHSLFQFTPVNQTGSCSETSAERVMASDVLGREPQKQIFEDCIVISPDGKRKISIESKMEKDLVCKVEPGVVCVDAGPASEDGLLTQIIDKKKELDNLIKKWAESREQKQNNLSHIDSDIQHRTVVDIKELLEDSKGSLTSKQADKNSDKQQLSSISVDETENTTLGSTYSKKTPITNPLTTETTETEISEHVTGANKSNLESCSVEEVPSFSEQSSSGVVEHCRSSDQRRQTEADTVTSESEVEMKEPTEDKPDTLEAHSVDRDNMVTVLPESKLVEPPDETAISIIDTTHSPDTNQADVNCVEDLKISQEQFPGGKEWSITEDEDQAETHNIQVTQESGPSSLPSEWQGASLEDLEEIQCDIESEQISLASEQSRQNRIAVTVSNEMYSECQELLQLFGVPYLVSPMEAEAQCAVLDVLNLTQGSVTDDSDIFLFGGRRVYKNIFNQNKHAEMYGSDAVQTILALGRTNLICLAFITGSDYTEGIPGVGVVGAMEIIHEFSGEGLEGLKKFKLWHQQAQKQTKSPQETKLKRKLRSVTLPVGFASDEVFEAYLNPVVDQSTERFEWGKPDLHALRLFASDKFGWPSSRTDELLLPVLKQLNRDQTQMKINQFFEVKFQEARAIKSKRLRRVLNLKLNPSSSNDGGDETGERKKNSRRMEGNEVLHEKTEGKRVHERGRKDTGSEAKQPRRRRQEVNAMAEASGANRERAWGRTRKTLPQRGAGGNVTTDLEATILLTPVKLSDNLYGSQLLAESGGKSPGGPSDPCVQTTSSTAYDGREADDSPSNSNRNVEAATRTRRKRPSSDEHITNPKRGHLARSGFRHARTRRVAERTPEDSTSDSSLSDEDCGKYYDGPRPVFVFRRGGRQRARSRRGRGR